MKLKYEIWDKVNNEYLDLTKYCVNGYGDVMTTKGLVLGNRGDFEIQIHMEKIELPKECGELILSIFKKYKTEEPLTPSTKDSIEIVERWL